MPLAWWRKPEDKDGMSQPKTGTEENVAHRRKPGAGGRGFEIMGHVIYPNGAELALCWHSGRN